MVNKDDKRSSLGGIQTFSKGVGARHKDTAYPDRGGRYLDICALFENRDPENRDPRLDEFKDMGLSISWRELAEKIGYENFILVWEHLSDVTSGGDNGRRVCVPRFESYMRYQRNRYIIALDSSGAGRREIKKRVTEDLNSDIHEGHVSRIIKQHNGL